MSSHDLQLPLAEAKAEIDTQSMYLLNPKKMKSKAHIWTGKDTACQMTSTPGFSMAKYVVCDNPCNLDICSFCKMKRKYGSSNRIQTLEQNQVTKIQIDTKIFCDGACLPNPGKAGSGVAIYRDNWASECMYGIYNPAGTNNTAELNALHLSLLIAQDEVNHGRSSSIFCDSQYSIQCVTEWAPRWEFSGWKKKGRCEIKNVELIKPMFELYKSLEGQVDIWHVNGHVGIEGNELADRMSMLAIQDQQVNICSYKGEINVQSILSMSRIR